MPDSDARYTVGERNIRLFGLDIHGPVFAISAILVVVFVGSTLVFYEQAALVFGDLRAWITGTFDWFFIVTVNVLVLSCLGIAFSKLGRVRLGGADATPGYSYGNWLAMVFAAGVGIGLMFFGVHEPVAHTVNPPLGVDPADRETARAVGLATAINHWGLHAWSVYAIVGLSLAFFCFNRDMPLAMRSAFYPLFGKAVWGPLGHIIDITAVFATLVGLSVSLAFGAEQIAGGLNYLFGVPIGTVTKVAIIASIIGIALISVIAGLDKGVKRLSQVNLVMAAALCLFVVIAGPTSVIVATIAGAGIDYATYLPALNNWIGREDTEFVHNWSAFYWAWWFAWSPFVGMFIARISYGRTVREFITWVLLIPTVIGMIWMSTFGGTALDHLFTEGYRGVADSVPELAMFKMLERLPFAEIASTISVLLIAIFFITSADSGSIVLDIITAGGKLDTPVRQRAFWCVLAGFVSTALIVGGGAVSQQALTYSIGLPFGLMLILMCIGLAKGLFAESGSESIG